MKSFILILLALCLIALGVVLSKPGLKEFILKRNTSKVIEEDTPATGENEFSKEVEKVLETTGATTNKASTRSATSTTPIPAAHSLRKTPHGTPIIDVERENLVGAWRAVNNSELLVLRGDGKSRSAMAAQYKVNLDNGINNTGMVTAVFMAEWVETGGVLDFKNVKITEVNVAKLKVNPGDQGAKVDQWKAAVFTSRMYSGAPEAVKKSYQEWLEKNKVGGAIIKFADDYMTLEDKDGEVISFEKVNPNTARDPDGTDAPMWDEDAR